MKKKLLQTIAAGVPDDGFRQLYQHTSVSYLIIDLNGKILSANKSGQVLFSADEENLCQQKLEHFITPEGLPLYRQALAKIMHAETPLPFQVCLNTAKSSKINVTISLSSYYSESPVDNVLPEAICYFATIQPVPDHHEVKLLESELVALKSEHAEMKRMVATTESLKFAFLQNVSHEIRTPLNAIMGFGAILGQPDINNDEKNLYGPMLKKACYQLLNNVNDYLDMSQLQTGTMPFHVGEVRVSKLLFRTFRKYESDMRAAGLKFTTRFQKDLDSLIIETDENLMQKCISHLLENAMKFTTKGYITLGSRITKNRLVIYVKDTGIGISAEARKRIFRTFEQEDMSVSRTFGGSGLGLSIVSGIMKILDGNISFNSIKGSGSTFFLSFPLVLADKDRIGTKVLQIREGEKPVILIVDDDSANRFLLEQLLNRDAMKIYSATNGLEALTQYENHPEINLVLMDIKMPGLDGLSATIQMKKKNPDLPVIAITAYVLESDENMLLEAGCADFIAKPFQIDELKERIRQVLM
jgi:signal transduction histidine kinase/CheY-like chemotaxis protein